MQIYTRLILAIYIVIGVGCSAKFKHIADAYTLSECTIGKSCDLTGELFISRGVSASVANLKLDSGECIALSLPEEKYNKKKLQFNKVRVFGLAYPQDSLIKSGIVSYELRDRMVAAGICETGKILYVEDIKKI